MKGTSKEEFGALFVLRWRLIVLYGEVLQKKHPRGTIIV